MARKLEIYGGDGLGDIVTPEGFYDQFKQIPQPARPTDIVWKAPLPSLSPEHQNLLDHFFNLLTQFFQQQVIFSKRASYLEPPFFATHTLHVNAITIAAGASFTDLVSYTIFQRHRSVVLAFGQETTNAADFDNLRWRFTLDGQPVPIVDNPEVTAVEGVGAFRHQLGTFLFPKTLNFLVRGGTVDRTFALQVRNVGAAPIDVKGLIFEYTYPLSASPEFIGAEYQL